MFKKAIDLAAKVHANQVRKYSNLPYLVHCLGVANNVRFYHRSDIKMDTETLMVVAVLHDTLEDFEGPYTKESLSAEISETFGDEVLKLVCELTNDRQEIAKVGKTEYMKQKLKSMSEAALFIKLCDRYDNVKDSRRDQVLSKITLEILNDVFAKLRGADNSDSQSVKAVLEDLLQLCKDNLQSVKAILEDLLQS